MQSDVRTPLMNFAEVRTLLKQRFPMIMVDAVLELVPEQRILTLKNVTGNEIQFLGHFPELAIMPGTLIVEAFGQSASILFSQTTSLGLRPGEFLMLGSINDMRFLAPVMPGDRMEIEVQILKMAGDITLVDGTGRPSSPAENWALHDGHWARPGSEGVCRHPCVYNDPRLRCGGLIRNSAVHLAGAKLAGVDQSPQRLDARATHHRKDSRAGNAAPHCGPLGK